MKTLSICVALVLLSSVAASQEKTGSAKQTGTTMTTLQNKSNLPPDEAGALAALNSSPRHGEWVDVAYGKTPIRSFVVYPERSTKAGVVIVIHEIYGASDWIRGVADQLAKDGFIGIVPDLISGMGPKGGGTESIASRDSVVRLIRGLSAEETFKRLNAVRAYAMKIPAGNRKIGTLGFCWGGGMSFGYACAQPGLNAAVVYYGVSPDSMQISKLNAPVLGNYGADDARVDATVEPAAATAKKLGKSFVYEMYEGAGHGFLRQQQDRDGANLRATEKAWPMTVEFLRKNLE
jgi:carboxymethylenebutenolidase